jgi:hypothetical protein
MIGKSCYESGKLNGKTELEDDKNHSIIKRLGRYCNEIVKRYSFSKITVRQGWEVNDRLHLCASPL